MVNSFDFNSILLSLIYKISSLKTEEELIKHATPDILKKFNCFAGIVLSFTDYEEKIIIPKNLINKPKWADLKQQIIDKFEQKPYDKYEIMDEEGHFYYAFRLSKYGLLVLGSSQRFEEGLFYEMYNLAEYFGKNLTNAAFELERSKKDKIIAQQIQLQDLLIQISTKYINADLSDLNGMINQSLEQIGKFVEADRSYIFAYDFINNTTKNTYEWCAEAIEPEIDNLQNIPIEYIPQWLESHKKGEAFYVEDVSLLPDDGEFGLKAILEPQGIQSLIAIPLIKRNKLIGFVGFDAVKKKHKYSTNEKNILFVFSNMLINVMQRKENKEQIKEQEARKEILLQNLEKQNQELNEYAHVVSHDLKAPLRNIDTLVNWVMEDNKGKMSLNCLKSLNLVLSNVEKMDLLIKGILDYSTIDKLEAEDRQINSNLMIDEVVRTLLIPKNITIKIQENLPNVYGNAWRFKQVFQNLIQNAIKYNDKEKGFIEVGATEQDNYFEFFIKDNGIGIANSYFDRIFKIFTKLESNNTSSGIGLSIVKKIIEFYKGEIWLESEEGKGTTFYFKLPKN